jgi:hypothetical protein
MRTNCVIPVLDKVLEMRNFYTWTETDPDLNLASSVEELKSAEQENVLDSMDIAFH